MRAASPPANSPAAVPYTGCVEPPANMVAWYPLDESSGTTADDLIAHNVGTLQGPTLPTASYPGEGLNGLHFAGGGSPPANRVIVPDQPALNFGTGDFTVDTWVRTTSTTTYNIFLNKQNWSDTVQGWEFYLHNGRLGLQLGSCPGESATIATSRIPAASNCSTAPGSMWRPPCAAPPRRVAPAAWPAACST